MLYLGIDQHKSQITVNLRSEDGSVILMRQVSTRWEKIRAFFEDLAERAAADGGFMAIVEVCGMNPWLIEMLKEYGCQEIVITQPEHRSKRKTDRRDAALLSNLLWINRNRLAGGNRAPGMRRINPPTAGEIENRQPTSKQSFCSRCPAWASTVPWPSPRGSVRSSVSSLRAVWRTIGA